MPTREALRPLEYRRQVVDGMHVLAHDPAGAGRIVEVLGDVDAAERIAVVVPGNAHDLSSYPTAAGGAAPRANGRALEAAVAAIAPCVPTAVLVWLGYHCPRGLHAAARRTAALDGAHDLRRLTHLLPASAGITLIGHSYGSVLCAAAADGGRVDDLVAIASPGLGVRHVSELRTGARVWALRGADDWVRFLPRGRIGPFGHGRQPADPGFGARVLPSADVRGHSGYYAPGSDSLFAIARVVTGCVDGPSASIRFVGNHAAVDTVLPGVHREEERRALAAPDRRHGDPARPRGDAAPRRPRAGV